MDCVFCNSGYPVTVKHRILVDYQGQPRTMLMSDSILMTIDELIKKSNRKSKKTRIVHGQTLTVAQRKKQYVDYRNMILGLH